MAGAVQMFQIIIENYMRTMTMIKERKADKKEAKDENANVGEKEVETKSFRK